jgi:hypothetical protein
MTPQHKYYKHARSLIEQINEHKKEYVVIWYSRENIRITAIVVQDLDSGQTHTFSIDFGTNLHGEKAIITSSEYDNYEKQILKNFYGYVKTMGSGKTWLHWRMRLANYGFSALANRYKSLNGRPVDIQDDKTLDICDLFKKRYGENFVNKNNDSWRIQYLANKNHIETAGYLEYPNEEEAYKNSQYDKILTSLSRKTSILIQFLDLSHKNKLKTDSKWQEIHGTTPQGMYDACKEKWWFNLIVFLLGLIIGKLIQ